VSVLKVTPPEEVRVEKVTPLEEAQIVNLLAKAGFFMAFTSCNTTNPIFF